MTTTKDERVYEPEEVGAQLLDEQPPRSPEGDTRREGAATYRDPAPPPPPPRPEEPPRGRWRAEVALVYKSPGYPYRAHVFGPLSQPQASTVLRWWLEVPWTVLPSLASELKEVAVVVKWRDHSGRLWTIDAGREGRDPQTQLLELCLDKEEVSVVDALHALPSYTPQPVREMLTLAHDEMARSLHGPPPAQLHPAQLWRLRLALPMPEAEVRRRTHQAGGARLG